MHVVVRHYSGEGSSELFNLMEQRTEDIKELISGVPGFVHYSAVRGNGGGTTVTVCQDKDGTDESTRRAKTWISENLDTAITPPTIDEGDTVIEF